jgi:hypothetical protein
MHPEDFDDSSLLVWNKNKLEFGNWTSGEDGDGSFTFSTTIQASQVWPINKNK